WVGVELSGENRKQLWVPPGFAHGFCVVRGPADIEYKCTDYYVPDDESGVLWCDPTLGIAWPTARPIVSSRDAALPPLAPDRSDLPRYHAPRS
ncbi:MAG TPA: dTDP-4-dehydrorhamnose 3,5-epimerase, partial [Gemmatimonadales bacterium]|nr:dTDP-4-dehydrorhamnose 3,5-epimerase [Gemmatimonadales bacterium]